MALLDDRLERVAADLEPVGRPVMFFGAGILHRYLDVPEVLAEPLRPTEEVDVLLHVTVQASSYEAARAVEAALQACGWRPGMRSHRRNIYAYVSPGDIPVDIVIDALYPADDWAVVAQNTAEDHTLPSGRIIRIPSPALFPHRAAEMGDHPPSGGSSQGPQTSIGARIESHSGIHERHREKHPRASVAGSASTHRAQHSADQRIRPRRHPLITAPRTVPGPARPSRAAAAARRRPRCCPRR